MSAALTSRERVARVFERRDHDRIPRYDTFWSDTIKRWQGEGLKGDVTTVLDRLGIDFAHTNLMWSKPFPGVTETLDEDDHVRVVRDEWGKTIRTWKSRNGTPEHLGFGCDSRKQWFEVYRPAMIEAGIQADPEQIRRTWRRSREKDRWFNFVCAEPFETTRAMIGDELALIAMADDPEWIRDVAVVSTDQTIRTLDAVIAGGTQPDGLWIFGDMAFNHATMCSPAMYRDLIWPEHRRLAQWAHAHRLKCIFHTDGNVNGVMDDYIDAGFDCLQPLEAKAGMDIRQLIPRYGDRLVFFGNVDVMILGTNDRDRIEAEVRSKLAAGMASRGYIYHSDHSVPPTVSWDTYQFVIDLVHQLGNYP